MNNFINNGLRFVTILSVVALSGCASVMNSSKQNVTIKTNPSDASLMIDGRTLTTPAVVTLKGKSDYPFTITKAGYKPAQGKVDGDFRIWSVVLGNIVNFTGFLGAAVDVWGTGAAYELEKDQTITLIPEVQAAPEAPLVIPYGELKAPTTTKP
jgi:hypothetical protein